MKRFDLAIDKYQAEWIFAPIRCRQDALKILLKSVKILLINEPPSEADAAGRIVLVVSKMSRIFFESNAKVYSLAFPFLVSVKEGVLCFKTHSHCNIDFRVTSEILTLISDPEIIFANDVLKFADPICTMADFDEEIWPLFRELLMSEEGYIRYDYDEKNANGHYHPINHFDVFFSGGSTFKLGLNKRASIDNFIDLLDCNTECHYVSNINT